MNTIQEENGVASFLLASGRNNIGPERAVGSSKGRGEVGVFCVVRLMLSWSRHACWLLAFHCRVRQVKVWGALMSCRATSMNDE